MNPLGRFHFSLLDSKDMADARRRELDIARHLAAELGRTAVEIARAGSYRLAVGRQVDFHNEMEAALAGKVSIPPHAVLPPVAERHNQSLDVMISNETTLGAGRRWVDAGLRPLALNFANGIQPGGGFFHGARAQEEVLCRSSGLYLTLEGDAMYDAHRQRPGPDSTDWAILSPDVPVFRLDDGTFLESPWRLSFLTCAAPYAPAIGEPRSGNLLRQRICRVLEIASAYGYRDLVLGAWGCGAFRNDPRQTAADFSESLIGRFAGCFDRVVFAICDWSPDRRFLGPFRDVFQFPPKNDSARNAGPQRRKPFTIPGP